MSSVKISLTQLSEASNKQSPASNNNQQTPKESSSKRHVFDFSKSRKTPSYSKDDGNTALIKKTVSLIYQMFLDR